MYVYGQLKQAQLQNTATDLSAAPVGLIWYNTALKQARFSDGAKTINILANDGYCVLGTSATASENIRLHKAGAGVLQFVQGDDVTAEGSLATALNKLSFQFESYTTAALPAAGSAGRTVWNTTDSLLNVDTGATWVALAATVPVNHKAFPLAETIAAGAPVRLVNVAGTIKAAKLGVGATAIDNAIDGANFLTTQVDKVVACYDTLNNKVVIAYVDMANANRGTCKVGTIDADGIISFGVAGIFAATQTSEIAISYNAFTDRVIIAYCDEDDSGAGKVIAGRVSTTTISFGSAVEFEAGDVGNTNMAIASTPGVVTSFVVYADAGDSNHGKAVVVTSAAGATTLTCGAVLVPDTSNPCTAPVCFWHPRAQALVTGFTTTILGPYIKVWGSTEVLVALIGDAVTPAYVVNPNTGDVIAVGVAADTTTINIKQFSFVDSITLTEDTFNQVYVTTVTNATAITQLSLVWDPANNCAVLSYCLGTGGALSRKIEFINDALVIGTGIQFYGAAPINSSSISSVYATGSNHLVLCYADFDDTNGECVVTKVHSNYEVYGILQAGGDADDSRSVAMLGGTSTVHTGKLTGSVEYIQADGTLGYVKTNHPIGRYLSDTELLVTKNP